jgi:hypothetical protein
LHAGNQEEIKGKAGQVRILARTSSSLPASGLREGLDDVGDLNGQALERTLVLCVSTAVLSLIIVARQNVKRATKSFWKSFISPS